MAKREPDRFLPGHRNRSRAETSLSAPRWFLREAVEGHGLKPTDIAVFFAVADNLDRDGVSLIAQTLIEARTGVSRKTVRACLENLVDRGILFELRERGHGTMMAYSIPRFMQIAGVKTPPKHG